MVTVTDDERAALLTAWALENPVNAEILRRLPALEVPQAHLVAGCLYQAAWNRLAGRPVAADIKDYDVFYFDDRDLGWDAEDRVIRRARALFADLGVEVEVKNQARVHLWYGRRFGPGYPALVSAEDGIGRYLVACTCIGIRATDGRLYAPYGLAELWDGVLRMNPANPRPALFQAKAESYRARWPWLEIVPPDA
jgi:hypothetical protein